MGLEWGWAAIPNTMDDKEKDVRPRRDTEVAYMDAVSIAVMAAQMRSLDGQSCADRQGEWIAEYAWMQAERMLEQRRQRVPMG